MPILSYSAHCLAPEGIESAGHGPAADYWSLGIMLYEFMCGEVPFGVDLDDPAEIYKEILSHENIIEYPDHAVLDDDTKDFIEQLLNRDPLLRIGNSVDSLKAHEWFADFDWEYLESRYYQPDYTPFFL